ncbi:hypothetical protein Tsubulata_025116 [Turnera subulata]|uniref:Uncharacterized protein n=1 Tax=Turnera subulata TaxID=218843 RepID=A0A9Q0G688_9ROSI|nr:hypothetical protein Tsubulata_025116 [Turnera subulata]
MNGYAKMIKAPGSPESRSIDSSDLPSAADQYSSNTSVVLKLEETKQQQAQNPETKNANINIVTDPQDGSSVVQETDQRSNEERFGAKLRRNSSVSAASALHFGVQKAFPMRRSSSVSEKYCRIYDQSLTTLASPIHDGDESLDAAEQGSTARSDKKKNNRSRRILRACKKLFGLH